MKGVDTWIYLAFVFYIMERIELKQIVGYLPYGLKVLHTDFEPMAGKFTSEAEVETMSNECITFKNSFYAPSDYYFGDLEIEIKPILRPLSDLTKEIEVNGEKMFPIEYLCIQSVLNNFHSTDYTWALIEKIKTNIDLVNLPNWLFESLYEWHFDIHGLIGKGMAIDINTLKDGN